jgi:histidine triad (HIT) family protein
MANEEQQCVFCHIASGKIPAKKVYEDDKLVAVLDINPATSGHVLVVPKEHVSIMPQMSEELVAHIGMVSKQLSHSLIRALKIDGTSIFVANGVAAGQRAPHFLLHVIPRKPEDGIALQPKAVKMDEKSMRELSNKLAVSVAKQFGIEAKPPVAPEKKIEKEERREEPKPAPKPAKGKLDEIAEFLTGGK